MLAFAFAVSLLQANDSRELTRTFNLPEDTAEISLKRFSEQSRRGVLFLTARVKGVKTHAVLGDWTPEEAMNQMLSNTGLVATVDAATRAFAIRAESRVPRPPRAAPAPALRPRPDRAETRSAELKPANGTTSPASAAGGEFLELSPFQINTSRDVGYQAENTLTGTRLNSPLWDTSASVSVFTKEFLEDTAVTDLSDLLRYSINSELNTNENQPGSSVLPVLNASRMVPDVLVRGFVTTLGLDYFYSITPTDPYRIVRYEEGRGPNSVLFGIGSPGGLLNQTSKIATIVKDSAAIQYGFGSQARQRLEFESNHVLRENTLAVSLAAVHQENGGWRAFDFQDKQRVFGSVFFRPIRGLSFTIMGETGREIAAIVRPTADYDEALAWYDNREALGVNAVTFAPNNLVPTAARQALGVTGRDGLRDGSGNHRVTFIENDGTFFDRIGTFLTGSYNNAAARAPDGSRGMTGVTLLLNDPSIYPRSLNAAGPGMFRDQSLKNHTLTADWQATPNLAFNLAHNRQYSNATVYFLVGTDPALHGEANRTLGVGGPANPYAGRLYFDGNWRRDAHESEVKETRLSMSYAFDSHSKWFGRHRLAALASRSNQFEVRANSWLALAGSPFNPSPSGASNRITVRNYITEGNYDTYRVGDWRALPSALTFEGKTYGLVFANDPGDVGNNGGGYQDYTSGLVVAQSHFLDGKFVTTLGYRRDKVDVGTLGYRDDPLIGEVVDRDRSKATLTTATGRTGTAGLVYHLWPSVSLIANRSSNRGVPSLIPKVFPDGNAPPPSKNWGEDFGLGFNLLGGRLNGNVVHFTSKQKGGITSSGLGDIAARNARVMEALGGALAGDGKIFAVDQWNSIERAYTPPVNVAMFDYEAKGYEARLTANLSRGWRILANYSYTDSGRKDFGREMVAWYGLKVGEGGRLQHGVTQDSDGRFRVDPGVFQSGGAVAKWLELGAKVAGGNPGVLVTANGRSVAQEILNLVESLNSAKEENEKRWGVRPHKLSLFTAYDFNASRIKGLTVGGGYRWRSANIIGTDSYQNEITGKVIAAAELMLAYTWKFSGLPGRVHFQLNISNLFDQTDIIPVRYATSSTAPDGFVVPGDRGAAFTRYDLVAPRDIRFTTTYSF